MNTHWIPNHPGFPCLFLLTSTFLPCYWSLSQNEQLWNIRTGRNLWCHPVAPTFLCRNPFPGMEVISLTMKLLRLLELADRPPHISRLPSQSSRSLLLAVLCPLVPDHAGLPISWKEVSKYRLEFSEELAESCDFPRKLSRSWPTGEEIAKITESSSMVRMEHIYLCVTHLTVASLPAVWDPEFQERGMDLELEDLGDPGHWYPLSGCFPT